MANTNKAGVQFTAYIPPETLESLKTSAKQAHRSINAQIVWFIEQGLKGEKQMGPMYTIIVKSRRESPIEGTRLVSTEWDHVKTMHPRTKQETILHGGARYPVEWYTSVDGVVYIK